MRVRLNGYRSGVLCENCSDLPNACCNHVPRFRPDDVLWMVEHGQADDLRKWSRLPNFNRDRGYFELLPVAGRRCFFHKPGGCGLDFFSRPTGCRIYLCFPKRGVSGVSEETFHHVLDEFMRLPRQLEAEARQRPIVDPVSWVSGLSLDWKSEEALELETIVQTLIPSDANRISRASDETPS